MLRKVLSTTFYRQFTTSTTCNRSFTLSFVIPDGKNRTETTTFVSAKDFQESFAGYRFTNPKTNKTYSFRSLPNHIDPAVTYVAHHPFLVARLEEYTHNQIADKVFEEKACNALKRHLNQSLVVFRRISDNPSRRDGWRILGGEKDIAEWEGIWETSDGHSIFLEAKHVVDMGKVTAIRRKLARSIEFLGVDHSKVTVYVAGNYWVDDESMDEARKINKFGVLTCNGLDLEVQEPDTT